MKGSLRQLYCLLPLLLFISSCAKTPSTTTTEFFAFGTVIAVTTPTLNQEKHTALNQALQTALTTMHQRWHAWQPSQLQQIHQACQTKNTIQLDPDMVELVLLGQQYENLSLGYFNPAAGELVRLWGFFSSDPNHTRRPPSADAISTALAHHPTTHDLHLSGTKLRCDNPNLVLDFGAFAKGYGMSKLAAIIQRFGIKHALINAGGDILTIGRHPNNTPWRVALTNPISGELIGSINSADNSVFTSGLSQRRFKYQGKMYHHLINPKTGYPAEGLSSVTVIAQDATLADAAATAIFAAGHKDWQRVAKALKINNVAVIDATGKLSLSKEMAKHIQFM